jgi:hypothetical protein
MGYYIRAIPEKKHPPKWKLQFVSYKRSEAVNPKSIKPKKEWDVRKHRWRSLGILDSMSLIEARLRARQLNAQATIKKQEAALQRRKEKDLAHALANDALIPLAFRAEFESRFLSRPQRFSSPRSKERQQKAHVLWNAAQKLILHIKQEPSEWYLHQFTINDFFFDRGYSISYINKIIKILNLWGFYMPRKIDRPFLPVQKPHGYEKQRLVDK